MEPNPFHSVANTDIHSDNYSGNYSNCTRIIVDFILLKINRLFNQYELNGFELSYIRDKKSLPNH